MKEQTKEFMYKLADLLEEYNIEITASDEWSGYAECGEDIQICIENNMHYEDTNMGTFIDPSKLREMATK